MPLLDSGYQGILVVAFGGPEGPNDVMPFLENVLRGRSVPRKRMLAVAEHYQRFGGKSPINAQSRSLVSAIEIELRQAGLELPVYLGNRNWHPFLVDTLRKMRDEGIKRSLALFTSAYSSYSSCRQYLENIEQSRQKVGTGAPQVDKLRSYFNHPGFIEAWVDRATIALNQLSADDRTACRLVFTAHSIPQTMAANCRYQEQLLESSRLVAEALGVPRQQWQLVYQSRSGSPAQPWLEPDIIEYLGQIRADGVRDVVIVPIGFISDHIEVLYDLDTEAREAALALGLRTIRADTLGTHPRFLQMIRELIVERITESAQRPAVGRYDPSHDVCPAGCCLQRLA